MAIAPARFGIELARRAHREQPVGGRLLRRRTPRSPSPRRTPRRSALRALDRLGAGTPRSQRAATAKSRRRSTRLDRELSAARSAASASRASRNSGRRRRGGPRAPAARRGAVQRAHGADVALAQPELEVLAEARVAAHLPVGRERDRQVMRAQAATGSRPRREPERFGARRVDLCRAPTCRSGTRCSRGAEAGHDLRREVAAERVRLAAGPVHVAPASATPRTARPRPSRRWPATAAAASRRRLAERLERLRRLLDAERQLGLGELADAADLARAAEVSGIERREIRITRSVGRRVADERGERRAAGSDVAPAAPARRRRA